MNPSAETDAPPLERELLGSIEAVYRFALRLARDPSAAEDLVQETYLRALTHQDQYTPGTSCRAWLFTICRNVFMKGEMRSAREIPVADVELDAVPLPAADPAGAVFELADLDEAVARALDRLPEEYRTVVTLVDIEDLSYATVADILGVPIGTVRSRLFRGRRLLQRDLVAYATDAGFTRPQEEPQAG
jgi:RNA polymerase sigma-70 factor (ECF subfamily)